MLYTSGRMIVSRRSLLASATAPFLLGRAFSAKAVQLFDGRTLDGWTRHGGGIWTVEDGEIVGRFDRSNPGAGYLMTVGEYEDFVFELEFWIDKGGNSGVFIREPKQDGPVRASSGRRKATPPAMRCRSSILTRASRQG
ncbi:MAG: DUF1080 domain-containing protein [Bryobacterales bacterium]